MYPTMGKISLFIQNSISTVHDLESDSKKILYKMETTLSITVRSGIMVPYSYALYMVGCY